MTKSKFRGLFEARTSDTPDPKGKRGRGRPPGDAGGKRSSADYTQAQAYITRELHRKVKAQLALEDREYSELVEELLAEWLKKRS